eukprot:TRINITY_DN666_c1_g1_i4.p1 TRINITY_DN666_c1_g1~~TRINITY_DN666_c1_g1_i4.p1  ORF type:complete len:222 (-),score=26.99 TRINITY_DN666_c1_g1_i4:87-752(-)
MEGLLWSDPICRIGRFQSGRNAGCLFGPDAMAHFLAHNKLELFVRSHQCVQGGVKNMFNSCLLTVFSASNYGDNNNQGAYLIFQADGIPRPVRYYANSFNGEKKIDKKIKYSRIMLWEKYVIEFPKIEWLYFKYYKKKDDTSNRKDCTINRYEWSEGLKDVLCLDIPFLEFQKELGLPCFGVGRTPNGPIDYMSFLSQFYSYADPEFSELLRKLSATSCKK